MGTAGQPGATRVTGAQAPPGRQALITGAGSEQAAPWVSPRAELVEEEGVCCSPLSMCKGGVTGATGQGNSALGDGEAPRAGESGVQRHRAHTGTRGEGRQGQCPPAAPALPRVASPGCPARLERHCPLQGQKRSGKWPQGSTTSPAWCPVVPSVVPGHTMSPHTSLPAARLGRRGEDDPGEQV